MHQLLQVINNMGIPTQSSVASAQHLGMSGIGQQADKFYIEGIYEVTNEVTKETDSDMLRMTFSYLVAEVISAFDHTDVPDVAELLGVAEVKAAKLVKGNEWMFAKAEGEVKQKKGSRKLLAKKIYDEQIKGKDMSRKDAIAILVEAGVSTPAGCSTYLAQLKAGTLYLVPLNKRKNDGS